MTSTPEHTPTASQTGSQAAPPVADPTPRPTKRPKRGKRIKAAKPPVSGPFVPHRVKATERPAD